MRITPERVIEAYKATGLKPIRSTWINQENHCGCALTAILMHESGITTGLRFSANNRFGVDYTSAFIDGFDGGLPYSQQQAYKEAYTDGQSSWQAVVHAGLVEVDS